MEHYRFIMQGKAFDNGDRLDKVASGLTALQQVFDGSYKAMVGKNRLSKKERESFQIVIESYKNGSFLAHLGEIYAGVQTTLPLLYAFTPSEIWEHTKTAFDFLTFIFSEAHKGNNVSITQDGQGNTAAIIGDATNNYYGPVIQIGTQIISGVRRLDDVLEENQVDRIGLGRPNTEDFELLLENKGLYYAPITVDKTPVALSCDIFDFNKYENQGKLKVSSEAEIPKGNYKFRNIGSQAIEEFILSMTETQVVLNCLVEYEHDPLSDTRISELLVVDIAA